MFLFTAQSQADVIPTLSLTRDNKRSISLSIVTQFYPPDYAATGQFIEELATNLARQSMAVQVFTGQPGYAFQTTEAPRCEQKGGVRVQRSRITHLRRQLGRTGSSVLFCLRAAFHLLRPENRGDLVLFVSEPPYLQTLGYLANLLFRMPYASLVYDLYPDVAVELGVVPENHWLVNFWNGVNRRVWQRAESIIVPSETMKERIASRVPQVADKITVIHNWADPTWIKPIPKRENPFAQEHQLVDQFTVLYSGNMGRCHDMDTILAAARELQGEPVRFVFIGAGPKREPCMQQVQEWGLTNCHFLPYQEKGRLPESLTACDLALVSIDRGMEGLVAPSKFYSALSSGRPVAVICEKHSYLRRLVAEANCGAAFDNGDSQGLAGFIRYLMRDSHLNQRLGTAGHRYIQSNFTPELISNQYLKVLQRVVLKDADLQRAIARQEFQIYYQPIVNLATGKVRGVEALLRWQHPERGWVRPADFLPAMEESGLIVPLGWWLINEACRQVRQWQIQNPHYADLKVSINLSHSQFFQPDLIPQLDRILDSNGLEPSCLTLEVGEEVLMADAAAATAILLQLRSRNIRVCLDGFGKGYTSLNYLHRFPISAIEVDRSLVSQISADYEAIKLIRAMILLAHDLGITISAEGIETESQLQHLKAVGIHSGQGHLFSQAVDVVAVQHLLQRQAQPSLVHATATGGDYTTDSHSAPLVMVVDDEKTMRLLLRRAVEKEGYQVIEADSGEQAIGLYQSLQPSLVLLDAMMPGMDGFACCSQLRQTVATAVQSSGAMAEALLPDHCPVLMITSLDDPESVDRAFEAGATDYITKPVNWPVLRQRLRRLLEK